MSREGRYEARLRDARAAIRAGKHREARRLLSALIREDPSDYRTWLWMAGLTRSPRASLEYLATAESLRPGDPHVARARAWVRQREAGAALAPATDASPPRRRPGRLPLLALLLILLFGAATAGAWRFVPSARAVMWGALGDLAPAWIAAGQPAAGQPAAGQPAAVIPAVSDPAPVGPAAVSSAADMTDPPPPEPTAPPATATVAPTPEPTVEPTATELPRAARVLPAKAVGERGESRSTWTPTPLPTATPTETPVPTPTAEPTATAEPAASTVIGTIPIGADEAWIDVNLSTQGLTAYRGSQPVYTTLVSSGLWQFPTVTGQFRIYLRYEAQDMSGYHLGYNYYLPAVPYVMYFYEDYALHGAYWHNNFGTPMSHGCVNLSPDDAAWLYSFAGVGTLVNVHY